MKKVWILEGWITREHIERELAERKSERDSLPEDSEYIEILDMLIAASEKRLMETPNGYWLGYQGRVNYKQFCRDSQQTMKNLKDRHMKWRVLKADLPDDAKYWVHSYVNGVENEGVLRYLYATL